MKEELRLNNKIMIKKIGEETVLFFLDSQKNVDLKSMVFVLNKTANEVISILAIKRTSFISLLQSLLNKFDVASGKLDKDLRKFISELNKYRIVEYCK